MTTDELLDAASAFWDNVSDIDAGYGQRRSRLLLYAQQAYDEIRNEEEWEWEIAEVDDTIPANTSVLALPEDFEEFSTGGGFFVSSNLSPVDGDWSEVEEKSVEEISALLRTGRGRYVLPPFFAVYSGALNFPPSQSEFAYKLVYAKAPLTLEDGSSQDLVLPARYHHTVLLPCLVKRLQKSKGDATDWDSEYQKGLAKMKKRERPRKTVVQQIPSALEGYQW